MLVDFCSSTVNGPSIFLFASKSRYFILLILVSLLLLSGNRPEEEREGYSGWL
jgi:hypothetical protein